MKARYFWVLVGLRVFVMGFSVPIVPALAQTPTPTLTPQPTATTPYGFVIPILQIPIILPTAFSIPQPTRIPIHYTPAPNLNPLGLNLRALDIIAETNNMQRAILDVMGVTGNILNFIICVWLLVGGYNLIRAINSRANGLIELAETGNMSERELRRRGRSLRYLATGKRAKRRR